MPLYTKINFLFFNLLFMSFTRYILQTLPKPKEQIKYSIIRQSYQSIMTQH